MSQRSPYFTQLNHLSRPLPDELWLGELWDFLQTLAIALTHVWKLADLPNQHRDPFGRLLAAQALVEHLPLVNINAIFDAYQVDRMW